METQAPHIDDDDMIVTMSYSLNPKHVTWLRREAKRRGFDQGRGKGASRMLRLVLDHAIAESAWEEAEGVPA